MPTVTFYNAEVLEGPGFTFPTFRAVLDEAPTVPVSFRWYTQDVTAGGGDYDRGGGTVTFQPGDTEATFQVRNRDDGLIEGNETFQIVAYDPRGLEFPDGAAALVATGTILDDDDGIADTVSANPGVAQPVLGPTPQDGLFPTFAAYSSGFIEADGGPGGQNTLVVLDRPVTTTTTISYYTDQRSAANTQGDYDGGGGTLTFEAGQRSAAIGVVTRGDVTPEEDESFALIFNNPQNLAISGGAQAYEVEVDILDNDSGRTDLMTGLGDFGTPIFGPDRVDDLPTIRIEGVDFVEGFATAVLLYTLDGPSLGPVSFDYTVQDRTANGQGSDFDGGGGTVTIAPGQQSGAFGVTTRSDGVIEGDEEIEVLFHSVTGARFEGGAPALETVIGYLDDDGGPVSREAGRTSPATSVDAPASTAPVLPVIQVFDATAIEGDGGPDGLSFLVTLDRPAPAPVTFAFSALPGTASLFEEFDRAGGTITIPAGEQSTTIGVTLRGDSQIEDTESFDIFVYNPVNANFAGNAIAQVARGRLLDNDSGPLDAVAGRGDPAVSILGPEADADAVRLTAVPIAVREFDSGTPDYVMPVILSEPARTEVTFEWRSVADGTATENDFSVTGSRDPVRIPAGNSVAFVPVEVFGETVIEGDETFSIEIFDVMGAVLANGEGTLSTQVRIAGDDGSGTAATSAAFEISRGISNDDDRLLGTASMDVVSAGGGNDTIDGLAGDDALNGDSGDDDLDGGAGDDRLSGGSGDDTIDGGAGADLLIGGQGSDLIYVDDAGDRVAESRKWSGTDTVISSVDFRTGNRHIENVELTGDARVGAANGLRNTITGTDGNNILDGGKNVDTLIGGLGDDIYLLRAPGDNAVETANGGTDTVRSFGSFKLDAHVENLFMQTVRGRDGSEVQFNGIGNELDNIIVGTPFDNTIVGREGSDTLRGQAGADTFVFDRGIGTDVDEIVDFNTNEADEGDIIQLKQSEFVGLSRGALAETAFHAGDIAADADDRILFNQATGQMWFDADGTGAADQILIATFLRGADVTAADIEVF